MSGSMMAVGMEVRERAARLHNYLDPMEGMHAMFHLHLSILPCKDLDRRYRVYTHAYR